MSVHPTDHTRPDPGRTPTGRALAGLLAVLLAVYVPGLFSLPVVDRDEARFAQASRQMLESVVLGPGAGDRRPIRREDGVLTGGAHAGSWAVPMLGDRPRLAKPPLAYWAQAASAGILTWGNPQADRVWHYRAPSVLAAVAACLFTWRLGVAMGRPKAGWWGAVLLGVCPMVVWDAHQARADQLVLAATTGAMLALFRLRTGGPGVGVRWAVVFWVSVGAGVLAKGPITPLVVTLGAGVFSWIARDWGWLGRTRPMIGLAVLGAVLAPWPIAAAGVVGWDVLGSVWMDEVLGRAVEAREGHRGPPGYHLVLLAALFWPGSLLTWYALTRSIRGTLVFPAGPSRLARWRARAVADEPTLFLLCWILPAWLVFEVAATKLPHYTLPLYPPIALLTAHAALGLARAPAPGRRIPPRACLVVWAVVGLALSAGLPIAVAGLGVGSVLSVAVLGALAAGVLVVLGARRGATLAIGAYPPAVGAMVVLSVVLIGVLLPRCERLWVTDRLAAILASVPEDVPVGAVGYHEDSLVFATRGRLVRLPPGRADAWSVANPGGVLVLPADREAPAGSALLGGASGLNYSTGDAVDLRVWRTPG